MRVVSHPDATQDWERRPPPVRRDRVVSQVVPGSSLRWVAPAERQVCSRRLRENLLLTGARCVSLGLVAFCRLPIAFCRCPLRFALSSLIETRSATTNLAQGRSCCQARSTIVSWFSQPPLESGENEHGTSDARPNARIRSRAERKETNHCRVVAAFQESGSDTYHEARSAT